MKHVSNLSDFLQLVQYFRIIKNNSDGKSVTLTQNEMSLIDSAFDYSMQSIDKILIHLKDKIKDVD